MDDTNIIYVDFAVLKFDDLKTYKELYNFCEGQYIDGKTNVIVVDDIKGSNAFLLSSDLSTLFTGRFIEIQV